ncbi:MAG: radical SAM protein [Deltaproteobacteria bacterium]
MDKMGAITIPQRYNYIAAFLTLACDLKCGYCINNFGLSPGHGRHLTGHEWVAGLNRIEGRDDLPVTLQGGEPSLHKDFIYIINNLRPEIRIDILTNLHFDAKELIDSVDPGRLKRAAPYASIRVSYHPGQMDLKPLAEKVIKLQEAGFSIGVWGVAHPSLEAHIMEAQAYCRSLGIDFRIKEFLGEYEGRMYGTYRFEGACSKKTERSILCKTTELIIGPDGNLHRCHSDLYEGRSGIGNITDPCYELTDEWRRCDHFGRCNPCDVKVKTDRFQVSGHTSVEIKELNNI